MESSVEEQRFLELRKKFWDRFDALPRHLRDWLNYCEWPIHESVVLQGTNAVIAAKKAYDAGRIVFVEASGN